MTILNGVAINSPSTPGNQQIESAPRGISTNVWNYENQRTAVLLPSGQRETMTYNADLRNARTET